MDCVDHIAFVAFARDEPGRLVGVARILRYPDDPESLDVGVTVADDYQAASAPFSLRCWPTTAPDPRAESSPRSPKATVAL